MFFFEFWVFFYGICITYHTYLLTYICMNVLFAPSFEVRIYFLFSLPLLSFFLLSFFFLEGEGDREAYERRGRRGKKKQNFCEREICFWGVLGLVR